MYEDLIVQNFIYEPGVKKEEKFKLMYLKLIWSLKFTTMCSLSSCNSAFLVPELAPGWPLFCSNTIFSFSLPISPLKSEIIV